MGVCIVGKLVERPREVQALKEEIVEADVVCLREGDQWGDLGVDGWIILGWNSMRWDVGIWTGLGWPRIETGGGRF